MKHIVSFSGGRTSGYMVHLMEQKRINDGWDVEYVFMDTGAEHPKTYEFIRNCVEHFGIELTCLRADVDMSMGKSNNYKSISVNDIGWDLSIMQDIMKKYGGFTINRPHCTDKLKSILLDKYKRDTYGKGNYYTWLGMRIDEPRRLKFTQENADLFGKKTNNPQNIRYLAEISESNKEDIIQWWNNQPFDLEIDEHLGNCVFCIKKSSPKIALAARDEPELFKEWESAINSQEVRLMDGDKFGIGHIYRKWLTPNMLIKQFEDSTTTELRERVYRGRELDTGLCSESCEVFSNQMDMFTGEAA